MIGELNQRAALLARTATSDGGGGFSGDWQSFASVWVSLSPQSGSEVFGPDASEVRVKYRIVLRRRADVAGGQRASIGTRLFEILAVLDEGGQSQTMTLLCEEVP